MDMLLEAARGLNKVFPDGNEPFRIVEWCMQIKEHVRLHRFYCYG